MPRPNPPRKRTRRRNPNLVKVPQQAQDEAAEESTPAPAGPARGARAAVAAGTKPVAYDTSEWSRRSLYVMVAFTGVFEIAINLFSYPQVSKSVRLNVYIAGFAPIPMVLATFIAMPLTKFLLHEKRFLRLVETALVGVFIFFIWIFLLVGASAVVGAGSGTSSSTSPTAPATPCPVTATTCSTATPAPATATPSAAASRGNGASPSPSPASLVTPAVPASLPASQFTALVVVDLAALAITPYIFYPVYRRLRLKPRPRPEPRSPR